MTKPAHPDWRVGFRLQDDPTFDVEVDRQLLLFDEDETGGGGYAPSIAG